jgi:hypothetical protein
MIQMPPAPQVIQMPPFSRIGEFRLRFGSGPSGGRPYTSHRAIFTGGGGGGYRFEHIINSIRSRVVVGITAAFPVVLLTSVSELLQIFTNPTDFRITTAQTFIYFI